MIRLSTDGGGVLLRKRLKFSDDSTRGQSTVSNVRPEYFVVTYVINPWMDPKSWARQHQELASASRQEWSALNHTLLDLGAAIELLPPVHGLPDLAPGRRSRRSLPRLCPTSKSGAVLTNPEIEILPQLGGKRSFDPTFNNAS